jgi:hypothetical protein
MGSLQNYRSFGSKGGPNIARNTGMGGATDRLSERSTTAGKSTLLPKEIRPGPKRATNRHGKADVALKPIMDETVRQNTPGRFTR